MTRLDTNYIIRYFVDDDKMADIAEEAILNRDLFVSHEVLAEVVYILQGVYGLSRDEVSGGLRLLIDADNIQTDNKHIIKQGLKIFSEKKLDFVDCLLCVHSKSDTVLTFDKKLQRCIDGK